MKNYVFLILALAAVITGGRAGSPIFVLNGLDGNTVSTEKYTVDDSTHHLVVLVKDAAALVQKEGEEAFKAFRVPGSRWSQGETYIFVLDPAGNMIVHPDPALEGTNQINLKDVNGKPIIRGILAAGSSDQMEGWYHYEWPVPGGLLPRWKSSFVRQVKAPSGKIYFVGCGDYNDRMEREFVMDMVQLAANRIDAYGKETFPLFYDPAGPFRVKDAYIFVVDEKGIELANPAFPNLEGRNVMDLKDAQGNFLVRTMFETVNENGSGWVDYMWPKPGDHVPTLKSTYVTKAHMGDDLVLVGAGVYLADAPRMAVQADKMTAPELMALVRDAALVFEQRGENAYPEFRVKGSRWFQGDTYFFVWTMDGKRVLNAGFPETEGRMVADLKDVVGRPIGRMILEVGDGPSGEGWIHYMYPEPGDIFPTWKSSFIKRVTFPSGTQYLIGCGIYNMQMDKVFIEDVVNRAADLVAAEGTGAFDLLRDTRGPFVFMDVYVFLDNLEGIELVNPAQPSLEGRSLLNERDAHGTYAMREYLNAALNKGSAWVEYYWYKPDDNTLAKKHTYVKLVKHGNETYVVGAGYYDPTETDR